MHGMKKMEVRKIQQKKNKELKISSHFALFTNQCVQEGEKLAKAACEDALSRTPEEGGGGGELDGVPRGGAQKGLTLEYCGEGLWGQDIGIAQANCRLDWINHYFEMEILSAGIEGCLAIGLAKSMYPLHCHPGWDKGSIGYHADNGPAQRGTGWGVVSSSLPQMIRYCPTSASQIRTLNGQQSLSMRKMIRRGCGQDWIRMTQGMIGTS